MRRVVDAPFPGKLSVGSLHDPFVKDDPLANSYLLNYADFLTPDSLYLGQVGSDQRTLLKSRPRFYDTDGMRAKHSEWIELTPKMTVPGNAIKEIKAKITIPDDPQYRGKKYMFLLMLRL